jgi:hypothetical protein
MQNQKLRDAKKKFDLPGPAKVPMRESYSFPGRMAIRIIYITPTKQRGYARTPILKPNKPVSPGKVAGRHLLLTVFLGICILGCDFLLSVSLQWIYGEKHRNHPCRSAAHREKRHTLPKEAGEPSVIPFSHHPIQHRTGYF